MMNKCGRPAVTLETTTILLRRISEAQAAAICEQAAFIVIVQGMLCSSFVYQLCRLGYLYRRKTHRQTAPLAREAVYAWAPAPSLTILVPSRPANPEMQSETPPSTCRRVDAGDHFAVDRNL